MATEVSICSAALLRLGDRPIDSLDEQTDRSRLCANLYAQARDFIIRRHTWNSCITRASLAPLAAAPAFDWNHQFLLPANCLRVLSVGLKDEGLTPWRVEGSVSGRIILCDENPCYLRYVFRNEDPATWDPGLVEAVTDYLCELLAYPVTKSATVVELMTQKKERDGKVSRAIDGQEDVPETSTDAPFIASRG